jgi:hypothetical protein
MKTLEDLKLRIEKLNKHHQIEILKIFSKKLCKLNENKSGVYINLSFVDSSVIDQLEKYLQYTKEQEETLNTREYQKEDFKSQYFIEKEDKEYSSKIYSNN